MERTRGIDWATLTLKDALDLAILVEEEAKRRYQEFVDQLESHRTPEAAGFFRLMVRSEEKHRATLAERQVVLDGADAVAVALDRDAHVGVRRQLAHVDHGRVADEAEHVLVHHHVPPPDPCRRDSRRKSLPKWWGLYGARQRMAMASDVICSPTMR